MGRKGKGIPRKIKNCLSSHGDLEQGPELTQQNQVLIGVVRGGQERSIGLVHQLNTVQGALVSP